MSRCECGATWTSRRICHCLACHRTFGGEYAFSMHQGAIEGCADPADLKRRDGRNKLIQDANGVWGQPAPDKGRFAVATTSSEVEGPS